MRVILIASLALLLPVSLVRAETEEELLRQGEAFDLKLQPAEALKYYLPAEKLAPSDPEVLKRLARQYRHLMADATSKEEKIRLGRISLEYATRAAAAAPADSEAQLSPAVSMGKMMPLMGVREQVEYTPRIKASADRALVLDDQNDTAWHVLGRWNRTLAEVSGVKRAVASAIFGPLPKGTMDEAEHCLQKAVAINPKRCIHYLELGRIYSLMGRKEDARRCLTKGLAMPSVERDDADMKTMGREILAGLH